MVLILAIDQFEAITERTLSVFVIHGNFRISFLAILKQKCQCLLKKLNFFGYNYACINKKGHVPTTPHGCQILLLLPQVVTHFIGEHKEYLSKLGGKKITE